MTVVGIVLPGTSITPIVEKVLSSPENRPTLGKESGLPVIKVGSGLIQVGEDILVVKAGCLHYGKPNRFWIEHRQKRVRVCRMRARLIRALVCSIAQRLGGGDCDGSSG